MAPIRKNSRAGGTVTHRVTVRQRLSRFSLTGGGVSAQMALFVYPAESARHNSAKPASATSTAGLRFGNNTRKIVVSTATALSSTATFPRRFITAHSDHWCSSSPKLTTRCPIGIIENSRWRIGLNNVRVAFETGVVLNQGC